MVELESQVESLLNMQVLGFYLRLPIENLWGWAPSISAIESTFYQIHTTALAIRIPSSARSLTTCCIADGAGDRGSSLVTRVPAASGLIDSFFSECCVYFSLGNKEKLKLKPIYFENHESRDIWKIYTRKQIIYYSTIPR